LRVAADDYLARLGRYATVEEREVKEASRAPTMPAQRREEAARLRERIPAGARVVALDGGGKGWSSEELAHRLDDWRGTSRPTTFLVGGSHGLDRELVAAADERWSLGALTLPHELARVVVLEQLYRGFTILRGEPYHK
ncbi:MAG TPA: 23S rRNA (pseudouridine(1915)-N(3))-methyltransferase RlmH, partial [Gemmatimonadales bacterium]|nr:23S rRNA (pseudouridine(1915)-N(3))-methyltransferase RlmH [Gemmatimonadales bacterium]